MPREIGFVVNGEARTGKEGDSLLAAIMNTGTREFRPGHAPICGMGICFECLVSVRGQGMVRACMVPLEEGLEVEIG